MKNLDATYHSLTRPWQPDELDDRYRAAYLRGASDLPAGEEPPARPLVLLATAVPRLISLAVAANVLHILPTATTRTTVADELLSTLDQTATGSLHRSHLALAACGHDTTSTDGAKQWQPYIYDEAAHHLHALSQTARPPSLIHHAQEAGRYTAIAIGHLDHDATRAPEAIADALGHLLTVSVFADAAATANPAPTHPHDE